MKFSGICHKKQEKERPSSDAVCAIANHHGHCYRADSLPNLKTCDCFAGYGRWAMVPGLFARAAVSLISGEGSPAWLEFRRSHRRGSHSRQEAAYFRIVWERCSLRV